jgi:hypothetical protein
MGVALVVGETTRVALFSCISVSSSNVLLIGAVVSWFHGFT